jgi:hypothetical protein
MGSGLDGWSSHHHERYHSRKHAEECLATQAYFGRGEFEAAHLAYMSALSDRQCS